MRVHATLTGVALLVAAGSVRGQTAPADTIVPHATALAGRVRDPLGHPLPAATVVAEERGVSTIVTDSGTFSLRNVPPGKTSFTVMRIGYAPVTFDIEMPPDTTVFVDVHLQPVTTLAETKVTGTALSPKLAKTGYYIREKTGLGYFLHPEDLARLKDFGYASLYLRDLPNVFIRKNNGIGYSVLMTNTAPAIGGDLLCSPAIFIDGSADRAPLDESLDPSEVYAVEVYTHGAQIPASLNVSMTTNPCGVIAFWTKAYQR
ncbi:MAG TPA: carboxypeptidase-like regulatory domain-containing protein [Gemmatimonadaceae bacterium]|nr:carboxypeptidase-like regulatory domain-containing protein [Gemmatimonadaceae bacterium]